MSKETIARIVDALKSGPMSRRDLQRVSESSAKELAEALDSLRADGKARRFTNWPLHGDARIECWTLIPGCTPEPG